jgi:hypothetical protein
MATIDIDRLLEHLSSQLTAAMGDALNQVAPYSDIDARILFLAFVRAADHRCSLWERVPDHYVGIGK